MNDAKCKICRRAGEKLFLKGDRCFTPKCGIVRKPYPPGPRRRSRRRNVSEFSEQLHEKQKLRNLYGLRERQFAQYIEDASGQKKQDASVLLLESLAQRLDNVVFLAGLTQSRSIARQAVSHGHIEVNGRAVAVPSFHVRIGNHIRIADSSKGNGIFEDLDIRLKKYTPPAWISLDADAQEAHITSMPDVKEQSSLYNTKLIIEYYAR